MYFIAKTFQKGLPFWFGETISGARSESLVLRAHDGQQFRAVAWYSEKHPKAKIGVVITHPCVDYTHHVAIPRLLEAGFHVLAIMSRGPGNDLFVMQEELVLDIAAGVRFLKSERGCDHVALFGHGGGASVLAYYQSEARLPPAQRTKESPALTPTRFDTAVMPAADLMVYAAPHGGQGKVLMDCIDPSVSDENDPLSLDPTLDLYDERNGFREPPGISRYPRDFLERYRQCQSDRVHRLDQLALGLIDRQKAAEKEMSSAPFATRLFKHRRDVARRHATDPVITIYRTMANPNYVDMIEESSQRDYGSLYSEHPEVMNYSSYGCARVCTARSWLSTWSGHATRADLVSNVAHIREPSLYISASRDRETLPHEARNVFEELASRDKTFHELDARHYFEPAPSRPSRPSSLDSTRTDEPSDVDALMALVIPWILERAA